MRLGVLRGNVHPDAPIYVGGSNGNGQSGSMTVQAVLKAVEGGWGYWDRKTQEWWYRVLADANSHFGLAEAVPCTEIQASPQAYQ